MCSWLHFNRKKLIQLLKIILDNQDEFYWVNELNVAGMGIHINKVTQSAACYTIKYQAIIDNGGG